MAAATAVALSPIPSLESERERWGALYSEHYSKVFRICLVMLFDQSAAEDATQRTFFQAWRGRNGFRGDSTFLTWVCRIAVNVCLMKRRHIKTFPEKQFGLMVTKHGEVVNVETIIPSRGASPEELAARKQAWEYFFGLIADVPDKSRRNVLLHHIEGLEHTEVAALTGTALAATKTRTFRGRERLRKEFQAVGYRSFRDIL